MIPLAYDDDLSIGVVCFHQTVSVWNLLKWEDLFRLTPHFHPGEWCNSLYFFCWPF